MRAVRIATTGARRRQPIDRRGDRLVVMAAIVLAVAFLVLAMSTLAFAPRDRLGTWLPLHLALAGAASTAIAGAMPFFSASYATAPPVDVRVRWMSLAAVAGGAGLLTLGFTRGEGTVAAVGGLAFVSGIGLVGLATLAPLRRGLGPRGRWVSVGYAAAIIWVVVGALFAIAFLLAWPAAVEAWARLRPAHAWLNLVGFVSLVIATTLLHFFPTVVGARISPTPLAAMTVIGLGAGAPLVALGFVASSDPAARLGALLVMAGAASLGGYASRAWRSRARWSTDADWHAFAMGGLVSAIVWFEIGAVLGSGRILVRGADVTAASVDWLIGPWVVGWMGLAVAASATHLVPAVGPGSPAAHARQRSILGRWARPRLAAADAGVALITLGLLGSLAVPSILGLIMLGVGLGGTGLFLLAALAIGVRETRGAADG